MTISLEDVSTAEAIEVPTQLGELLSDEEADRLREDLERIADGRRQAATDGATMRLA
ncbi:hypothetical protein [Phycicoccus sp.]|uniref:hypothetical protein n=1 Tax=Phycicoccus sp. TaxID=1902410 RepID=UPI00345F13E3